MRLSDTQEEVVGGILDDRRKNFSLVGLAGTGKTTIVKEVYERWSAMGLYVTVMAPTGKASMVLNTKGVPAITIHRGVYNYRGKQVNDGGDIDLIFKRKHIDDVFSHRFIIDESSMVTKRNEEDIGEFGVPTLWVGDPGQLPPVRAKKSKVLSDPDYVLREIHRQVAGSPIIKFAYALRKGASLSDPFTGINRVFCDGKGPLFVAGKMKDAGVDHLVVRTNEQRCALNKASRMLAGRKEIVEEGEGLIILLNNKDEGVVNGEFVNVLEVQSRTDQVTQCLVESPDLEETKVLRFWNDQFGKPKTLDFDDVREEDDSVVLADYSDAITCHKMQGSSCRHVGIVAKGYCGDSQSLWNYTAATRSEQDITVFC